MMNTIHFYLKIVLYRLLGAVFLIPSFIVINAILLRVIGDFRDFNFSLIFGIDNYSSSPIPIFAAVLTFPGVYLLTKHIDIPKKS